MTDSNATSHACEYCENGAAILGNERGSKHVNIQKTTNGYGLFLYWRTPNGKWPNGKWHMEFEAIKACPMCGRSLT